MSHITILHTNDSHNKLTPEIARRIREIKDSAGALYLDAGDAIWAGNVYFRPSGEPALDYLEEAGCDAMTVGNREFHFTQTGFASKLSRGAFPKLCANIRSQKEGTLPCQPYTSFTMSGVRVVVLGVTVAMVTPRTSSAKFSAFVFDNPVETAVRFAGKLRPEADLLIAMNHIGLQNDRKLAQQAPEIDLIIGGHSHDILHEPEVINGVTIVQAGCYAKLLGRIEAHQADKGWSFLTALINLQERETA